MAVSLVYFVMAGLACTWSEGAKIENRVTRANENVRPQRTYLAKRVAQERNQTGDQEYVREDDEYELHLRSAVWTSVSCLSTSP